jgi:hypothetical protein
MAYLGASQHTIIIPEVTLTASPVDVFKWTLNHPVLIKEIGFIYSEATPASITTAGVVSFMYTPNGGSPVEKATYTAEVNKGVGYEGTLKDSNNSSKLNLFVRKGDTITFRLKTSQTSGTTGKGRFVVYYEQIPDGVV